MDVRIDLPPVAASVAAARRFVGDAACGWGVPAADASVIEMLVSELAANAVVHAASSFAVVAKLVGGSMHVAVEDACPAEPVLLEAPPEADRGRGLAIIDGLAEAWGVDRRGGGKSVWFQVATGRG